MFVRLSIILAQFLTIFTAHDCETMRLKIIRKCLLSNENIEGMQSVDRDGDIYMYVRLCYDSKRVKFRD